VDYEFIGRETFQGRIASGELIEWAEVYDHLYGTPRSPLESNRKTGIDTILAIEIQGARRVRELFPEAITIFLKPPSLEVLRARLRERRGEEGAALEKRLQLAREEMGWISEYEYTILNKDLEEAAGQLQAVIVGERRRVRAGSSPQKGSS
jgi:guanylate kinase